MRRRRATVFGRSASAAPHCWHSDCFLSGKRSATHKWHLQFLTAVFTEPDAPRIFPEPFALPRLARACKCPL